jgi:hypothetical protein
MAYVEKLKQDATALYYHELHLYAAHALKDKPDLPKVLSYGG